ncbi:MAG: DUF881 domain-containing protein [Chloroflexota bacterium]|nr:MAG: DUF881 domain-containing protein [Chloroflexota bacterium]
MLRVSKPRLYLTLACFLIGLLAVMTLRTQSNLARMQPPSPSDQAQVISNLVDANSNLEQEISRLDNQLAQFGQGARAQAEALMQELGKLKVLSGEAEATGPGVEVWLGREISVPDMVDLINEMRNAGAEAIAVNDLRIITRSSVSGGGANMLIDNQPISAPFVLRALGDPETIERALERKGGLVSLLRVNYPGLTVRVTKYDKLVLPVYQMEQMPTAQKAG